MAGSPDLSKLIDRNPAPVLLKFDRILKIIDRESDDLGMLIPGIRDGIPSLLRLVFTGLKSSGVKVEMASGRMQATKELFYIDDDLFSYSVNSFKFATIGYTLNF